MAKNQRIYMLVSPSTPRALRFDGKNLDVAPDLSTIPNVSEVRTIYLSINRLTGNSGLDLDRVPKLKHLYITNNELTECPPVHKTPNLQILNLENNKLTDLPKTIFSLSQHCNVYLENNQFSQKTITKLNDQLENHRRRHPGQGPRLIFEPLPKKDPCQGSWIGGDPRKVDPRMRAMIFESQMP